MSTRAGSWWATRSLALRLTMIATVVLAVGLVAGAAGLAALFFHNRVEAVDANARSETMTVTSLLRSGQLPDPLPAPDEQPVLAQVVDTDGNVVAATPSASRVVPLLPLAVLRDRLSGQPFTTDESSLGSAPLRVTVAQARLHGSQVIVVSAVLYDDVRGTLTAMLRTLVVAVPVVLLAAAIATWLAVRSALRPVDQLRAAADEVADPRGRTAPHLPVPQSGDELARLAETLNRMLARLHRATDQQTTFVADAAHELRSPLASMRAQLDVALSTPTADAEWEEVARGVLIDVDRVARLADDLLLLARLDSGIMPRPTLVDAREVLDLAGAPSWVEADPRGLRRAFDNLVSNAHRHANSQVEVSAEERGNEFVVIVDDDGDGVAPSDRERVFERWLRLDDARARDDGGAGLGLAIARSVAQSHGGEIILLRSPLGGLRAELRMPLAADDGD
jgi:signal transduction histidine kinase